MEVLEILEILFYLAVVVGIVLSLIRKFRKETQEIKQQQRAMEDEKTQQQEMKEYADLSRGKLFLRKRGERLALFLKIHNDKNYILDYKPKQYIFTSATVGGITTGGVDSVGGYNYVSSWVETGKCTLQFFSHKIETIQLTDSLYEKAKKSEIAKYLNDKKQIVVEDNGLEIRSLAGASAMGYAMDTTKGSLVLQNAAKAGYPSQQKCVEIMNWLCVNENPTI